jgi:anti-anti-sigma factor
LEVVVPEIAVRGGPGRLGLAPAPRGFRCTWKTGTCAAWVHLEGELGFASAPELEEALREYQLDAQIVVLDLRDLSHIDQCGLSVILDCAAEVEWKGGRLLILRGPAQVDRAFTLSGACNRVLIFDLDPHDSGEEQLDGDWEPWSA